ncbi:MAG TPA: sigma-70 family RNA polymerase sigma factor [Mycobacteriales bacterium]|nr:sigma-70 family RNA polymerase sigma factor [Mycobacteriales bacterium]
MTRAAVERAHQEHWGRLLALLTRLVGNLDVAEESLQDAYEIALTAWARDGVPARPEAWLLTAARRRATDRFRRDAVLARKLPLLVLPEEPEVEPDMSTIPDERLRLLFTCCHPALPADARVALTLRLLGGLTTAEIARAFLVPEPTMAARITRAKKKIAAAGIPYRVPSDTELPERLAGVLAVLYLVFTEGHSASSGDEPVRRELCDEAIRLARVVVALMPDEPEAAGLLALLLLQHARRDARTGPDGQLVLLPEQDRSRWDADQIAEGLALLRAAARRAPAGPYLVQAAIAAEHARAATAADTAWDRIAALYAVLEDLTGSPVVRLNRAVAVAEVDGPAAGLALLADVELPGFHLLSATRADLLRRLGRVAEAAAEYTVAIAGAGNAADRTFLTRRRDELTAAAG